jgi:hypothetical protein
MRSRPRCAMTHNQEPTTHDARTQRQSRHAARISAFHHVRGKRRRVEINEPVVSPYLSGVSAFALKWERGGNRQPSSAWCISRLRTWTA